MRPAERTYRTGHEDAYGEPAPFVAEPKASPARRLIVIAAATIAGWAIVLGIIWAGLRLGGLL